MSEAVDSVRWVIGILKGDSQIDSLVSGRVYVDVAPPKSALPYIIVSNVSPMDNMTFNANRINVSNTVTVKAVGEGRSYDAVEPIVDQADSLLHAQSGQVPNKSNRVMSCVGVQPVMYPEFDEATSKYYVHLGRDYDILVSTS